MSGVFISNNAPPRIGLNQYARNGLSPVAEFQNMIAERVGYAVRVRAKMAWRSPGQIWSGSATQIPLSSASERTRWRFAAHAAPYAQYLFVRFWQARQSSGTAADCYSRLRVADSSGTLIGDAVRHFGSSGSGANDNPYYLGDSTIGLADTNEDLVEIPPNAAYFGTFADFNYARLVAACVWEVAFDPNTDEGYPDVGAGSGSPIYDKDRADAATMINKQWAYGAQPLWHWSVDTDAGVRTLAGSDLSGSLTQSIGEFTLSATGTVSTNPPTFQATTALETSTGSTVSVSWPAHATNDIALLSAITGSSTTPALTGAGGSGWSWITAAGSAGQYLHVWYQRASSASMDTVSVENIITDGWLIGAAITTYRGCGTSGSPVNVSGGNGLTATTSLSAPGVTVTTTLDNTILVSLVGVSTASNAATSFSGWAHSGAATSVTERLDANASGADNNVTLAVTTATLATAGSAHNFTATIADSVSSAAILLALKP